MTTNETDTPHENPTVWQVHVYNSEAESTLIDWLFSDRDRAFDAAVQQVDKVLGLEFVDGGAPVPVDDRLFEAGFEDMGGWWAWVGNDEPIEISVREREVL